jgi:peptidyl-tRNA hydrolase
LSQANQGTILTPGHSVNLLSINNEEFEDTKGVIRIRISKKDTQHNGQKKKDKQRSTKQTHKTKDGVTRTPLKTGVNSCAPEG